MAENPIHALKSILDNGVKFDNIILHPITIASYAIFDLIDSIFIRGLDISKQSDGLLRVMNIVQSIYTLTLDEEQLKKISYSRIDDFKKDAILWMNNSDNILMKVDDSNHSTTDLIIEHVISQMKDIHYLVPEFVGHTNKGESTRKSSNGWLTQLIYYSVKEFGFPMNDVLYKIPMTQLILMMRQKVYNDSNGEAFTLEDKESIDNNYLRDFTDDKSIDN